MGFLLDSYRFNNVVLPDFSGYNVTRQFSLFKTNLATINTPIEMIQRSSGNIGDVSFDSNGDFSGNSLWSYNSTTIGSNLGIDSDISKMYCQITGYETTFVDIGRRIIDSGAIVTKQGYPSFINPGTSAAGNALTELDNGNDFTIIIASSSDTTLSPCATLTTSLNNSDRLTLFTDRRSVKRLSLIRANSTSNFVDLISQVDSSDLRVIAISVNGTSNTFQSFYNGVFQGSGSFSGTYTNDRFRLGTDFGSNSLLTGYISSVTICDTNLDATAVGALTTKIQTKLGI